jgi:hypothetical protein
MIKASDIKNDNEQFNIKGIRITYDNKTFTIKEYIDKYEKPEESKENKKLDYKEWTEENYD